MVCKRIVVVGNSSGGMYDFRQELISEILTRGYEVTVFTPFDVKIKELRTLGVDIVETPINRRGINPLEEINLFFLYKKLLKDFCPDLVIGYTIKPNIYAAYVCRILKIPYVANVTGLGTTFYRQGILKKIIISMYKVSLKRSKLVFFENVENRKTFVEYGIVRDDQTHVLNGAGVNLQHYEVIEYPVEKKIRFLFIGRIMKEKGIDELFDSMRRLLNEGIDCTLMVLGGLEEDYEDRIEQGEKEEWLQYYGYQNDVRPYIAKSHCFVLPSWHEGMANTNLENAACGRPIITSNIHGCCEAVQDEVSGFLIESRNTDSLYSAMKKFVNLSYDERRAMGIAGRKRMEMMFDKKNIVAETINILTLGKIL